MNGKILSDKTALITGASSGLGLEISKAFFELGADIIICARNEEKLRYAKEQIELVRVYKKQILLPMVADVGSEMDNDKLIQKATDNCGLDILVNNAAIQGPIGRIEDNDWEMWKDTIRINFTGPSYLMRKSIEYFKNNGKRGKIINISGGGATGSRPFFSAYAAAKVALVRLTELLSDENREYGIDINAIAPGAMKSKMTDEIINAGVEMAGYSEIEAAERVMKEQDNCVNKAVELATFLASSKSDGITGKIISAKWDRWSSFINDIDTLINSDVYTLRRITAKDRGYNWDV